MAKITLKADPTFIAPVPVHVPGKGDVKVNFTFKHRTTDEFNDWVEEGRKRSAAGETIDDALYIQQFVVGWDLDETFNAENLSLFLRNFHRAGFALGEAYARELTGARLGN